MTPHTTSPQLPLQTLEFASVGRPITRAGVSLFPVYLHGGTVDIATGNDSGVTIEERPTATVPTLVAHNTSGKVALLVDGQIVEGGLQTRVLNVSVLIGAKSTLDIPVSCVEQGRWRDGGEFRASSSFAPRRVRRTKQVTVEQSVREAGTRFTDQGAVWASVHHELDRLDVASASSALSEAVGRLGGGDRIGDATAELRELSPLPGQCGVIVSHGSRVVSAEVFAAPAMLAAHWPALVGGIMLDAPAHAPTTRPSATRALRFLRRAISGEVTVNEGVGLGLELHVRGTKTVAQALVHDGFVVHASAFALAA